MGEHEASLHEAYTRKFRIGAKKMRLLESDTLKWLDLGEGLEDFLA